MNLLFYILENTVPADELGKFWGIFEIIVIILGIAPWIVLLVYLVFFKKYSVSYFVNDELVHKTYYKKNSKLNDFTYNEISIWYVDEECTKIYDNETLIKDNIKLFAKKGDINE